jgi:hypothetical protein
MGMVSPRAIRAPISPLGLLRLMTSVWGSGDWRPEIEVALPSPKALAPAMSSIAPNPTAK